MDNSAVILAFAVTLFAGLSTGIGSTIAFFSKKLNSTFLTLSLGFSAGVMIYISFTEIFIKGKELLIADLGVYNGSLINTLALFSGIAFIGIIDYLIPDFENPHELHDPTEMDDIRQKKDQLYKMGMFTALAIAIHNAPEGLATFISTLHDPKVGISIGLALAIHNIPEGIAVAVPVYFATGSRKKAFWLSFLSGLAEPLGALVGYFLIFNLINDIFIGTVFSFVAGIMIYISLDELLPAAEKYGKHHQAISGLIAGMAVMAISLIFFI